MGAIEIQGLTKIYPHSPEPALSDLTLDVEKGALFGFLGPNGAGKTTTIRILTTLMRPTRGRVWVNGHDVVAEPLEAKRRVGYTPEQPGFYAALTGTQHLRYWGRLYGLRSATTNGQLEELLGRVGLGDARDKKAKAYSLGMRRRLALAGALLPDPELLILDEPSLGLDPQGTAFVRNLLLDLHREGRTVFLSSHILSEVERICTKVGVLHRGRLLRVDTPRALGQALGGLSTGLEIETRGLTPDVSEGLSRIPGVTKVDSKDGRIRVFGNLEDDAIAEVNRFLIGAGIDILASRRIEANLEEAFLALTEGPS